MRNVFPTSVCTELRMEAERIKQELLAETKPPEDVLHATLVNIVKAVSPHVVVDDTGINASSMAVANVAHEVLVRTGDTYHTVHSLFTDVEAKLNDADDKLKDAQDTLKDARDTLKGAKDKLTRSLADETLDSANKLTDTLGAALR
eukprot:356972-Prymnesium_polylepis.2